MKVLYADDCVIFIYQDRKITMKAELYLKIWR